MHRLTDFMVDQDKLNTLLHYMNAIEPFSVIFKSLNRGSKSWCPFTHQDTGVDPDCYTAHPAINSILAWSNKYVQCAKFLDADRYAIDRMTAILHKLSGPHEIENYRVFSSLTQEFQSCVGFVENGLIKKLTRLHCAECVRLDEALSCFHNYCFMASVTMAVSAVEFRLIDMLKKKHERLYKKEFSRFTLGQLIQVFDKNQYNARKYARIKKLLPVKHQPLLLLLNQYRTFSVHPKDESVTPQVAESILHLSFTFLIDPETCAYTAEELKCTGI